METVKTITSRDGNHRIQISRTGAGLYRYVTYSDRYPHDEDFIDPPHWTIERFSGLYASAEAAENDATAEFAWLRE